MKPTKQTRIVSELFEITCKTYEDGQTAIESNLMDDLDESDTELCAAFDAIESLVLTQYAAGIKIGSPAYAKALEETLEAIMNHLD